MLRSPNSAAAGRSELSLFGSVLRENEMRGLATSLALVVLMAVVSALDRRFHRLGHGWRGTGKYVLLALAQATNEPESRISFQRYRASSERQAEWFSLQPLLYYLLILGGGLSYFAFK